MGLITTPYRTTLVTYKATDGTGTLVNVSVRSLGRRGQLYNLNQN